MQKPPNANRFTGLTGIIFISFLVALTPGCGRKLFPTPTGGETAPQVRDLQPQVTSQGVDLSWLAPAGGQAKELRYSILKSEVKWENRNCPECPGLSELHEVQFLDAASAEKAGSSPDGRIHWVDPNVAPHHAYRYQVAVQNAKGSTVALSNAATARIYPGPTAPVNVVAATQQQGILIQWKPGSKDVEGHEIKNDLSFLVERLVQNKGWEKASPTPSRAILISTRLLLRNRVTAIGSCPCFSLKIPRFSANHPLL